MERDAVVGERAILADALRHGMGTLLTAEARAEFEKSIAAGELIEVAAEARKRRACLHHAGDAAL